MNATQPAASGNRKGSFAVMLISSMVSSLIMLDSNIVAVSLPAIRESLNASFTDIEWVVSAYVLTYAALLLGAGAFADLKGRKKAMMLGLFIFAASSAACGLANSALLLNVARAVQGVGGALLLTASLAVISRAFSGPAKARAFVFWGAAIGIALTSGPIVGGLITKYFGWRWVFLVNLPLSVGLIAAAYYLIEESKDPDAKELDLLGVFTFSFGLAALIWALIDGNDEGWSSPSILLRLGMSLVLFVGFVVAELHQKRAMVDFGLFTHRTFLGSVFAMIAYGASAQVMVFYLPLFLQTAYGFDPVKAGFAMVPFAIPMVVVPRLGASFMSRFSGRMVLTAGLAISLAGNLAFWLIASRLMPYSVFVVSMLIAGTGAGILNGETVKVLQGSVPPDRAGMASGLASTTRFIGVLVSVAGLGAVLANVASSVFISGATSAGVDPVTAQTAAQRVTAGDLDGVLGMFAQGLQARVHDIGLHAFANGFASATLAAAVVAAVGCVLTYTFVSTEDTCPEANAARAAQAGLATE